MRPWHYKSIVEQAKGDAAKDMKAQTSEGHVTNDFAIQTRQWYGAGMDGDVSATGYSHVHL